MAGPRALGLRDGALGDAGVSIEQIVQTTGGKAGGAEVIMITHHALVYLSSTTEDPKPHACESFGVTGRRMVYAWAPGGEAFDLPAAAGLPIEGKTHFVVQMHYSNLRHLAGQTDASGVDLCATAALRPNDADVLAVGSTKFSIPPRSTLRVDWPKCKGRGLCHDSGRVAGATHPGSGRGRRGVIPGARSGCGRSSRSR